MYNYPMKLRLFSLFLLLLLVTSYLFPVTIFAQGASWNNGRCAVNVSGTDVATIQGFECLFKNVLTVIVTFAGIAFLVMFVVGGFQYMTSSNDPKAVAAASSTLTYAIIGLVGVIVSWLILAFIADFTQVDVTKFQIPG